MTATWRAIARKDVEDAVRSRVLWGLILTFVAFLGMALLSAEELVEGVETVTPALALAGVASLAQLFIPGVAIVAGYLAISGERSSGSLRVLLSYPFSRVGVVLGKVTGRLLVTTMALAVGFAVASVLVVALYGTPSIATFTGFIGTAVLLGAAFTGLAVGGSAMTHTRGQSLAITVGPYVAMVFFWKPIVVGLHYLITGTLPGVEVGSWYLLVKRLNPLAAYRTVAGDVLGEPVNAVPNLPLEDLPTDVTAAELETGMRLAGEVPVYLEPWSGIVILATWGVIPLGLGYWKFRRSDIAE